MKQGVQYTRLRPNNSGDFGKLYIAHYNLCPYVYNLVLRMCDIFNYFSATLGHSLAGVTLHFDVLSCKICFIYIQELYMKNTFYFIWNVDRVQNII